MPVLIMVGIITDISQAMQVTPHESLPDVELLKMPPPQPDEDGVAVATSR